eukprot:229016_1
MLFLLIIFLFSTVPLISIQFDRDIYTNDLGNIQHDGHMVFSNNTFTKLSLQWKQTYETIGYCNDGSPYPTMLFIHGMIYCLTNASTSPIGALNESIIAIDVTNQGKILWQTYIHTPRNNYASLIGLAYIKDPNYIAVSDDTTGMITLLDASNKGKIVQQITFEGITDRYCSSDDGSPCIFSYVLGVNQGLIAWYRGLRGTRLNAAVTSYNLVHPTNNKHNYSSDPNVYDSILTICNDVLISTDLISFAHGYALDEDLNIMERLWNYTVVNSEAVYDIAPVCIRFNDSSAQIIFGKSFNDETEIATNVLIDVQNGEVIDEEIKWKYDGVMSPVVYASSDVFLFRNNGRETVCYEVNVNGYDAWNVKWKYVNDEGETVTSLLIANDVLFQSTLTGIDVLDVWSGDLKYKLVFDRSEEILFSRLLAGQDANGSVWLVANCFIYGGSTVVYAFS